jgi:hypothetical protein
MHDSGSSSTMTARECGSAIPQPHHGAKSWGGLTPHAHIALMASLPGVQDGSQGEEEELIT